MWLRGKNDKNRAMEIPLETWPRIRDEVEALLEAIEENNG